MVRVLALVLTSVAAALTAAAPSQAATIYVYVDPLTLEKRSVQVDPDGPDRAYLCLLPPATSGCHRIPVKRERA